MRLCPWSLASRGSVLGLASNFFVSLALASSLVSLTPPLLSTVPYFSSISELYRTTHRTRTIINKGVPYFFVKIEAYRIVLTRGGVENTRPRTQKKIRGQGQERLRARPRTQPQVFSKKKVFNKVFQAISNL